jgi:hypothetical protein
MQRTERITRAKLIENDQDGRKVDLLRRGHLK